MNLNKCTDLILDSDVIISFIKGGKIEDIDKIFPNQLLVTDVVIEELKKKSWNNKPCVEYIHELLEINRIRVIAATVDPYLWEDYMHLKKTHGKGESMSMAYCKKYGACLCSSNYTDISQYSKQHHLIVIPILDFVFYAHKYSIWDLAVADYFIYDISTKGDWIPKIASIVDYKPKQELVLDLS